MAPVPDGNREGPNRNESEISDLDTPPVNLEVESESSSDDDTSAYSGYQLLSQDPETTDTDGVDQHMTEVMENIPDMDSEFQGGVGAWDQQHAVSGRAENLPPAPNNAAEERRALWNKPVTQSQPMDGAQVQQIKSAMANFKLPTPDWARTIPEDRWKERLFQRLSPGVATGQGCSTKDSDVSKCQGVSEHCVENHKSGQADQNQNAKVESERKYTENTAGLASDTGDSVMDQSKT